DLEHPLPPHLHKVRYAVHRMGIDEEVLVVARFHFVVNTWYFTSLSWSSSRIRAWIIFSGCGMDLILADMSAKFANGLLLRSSRISHISFLPMPGSRWSMWSLGVIEIALLKKVTKSGSRSFITFSMMNGSSPFAVCVSSSYPILRLTRSIFSRS